MKHTYRNILIALGLASSLAVPGLALADNWNSSPAQYSPKQYQAQRYDAHREYQRGRDHDREFAYRDGYPGHEWREHHRWQRFDRDDDEWREHAQRYYRWHREYGYGYYPGAYVSGFYVVPTPRVIIDLR
jgi:hypothetical protein